MLKFTYPGVYTRELSSGVHTISGAATSVALFVGPTVTGIDGRPIRVLNYGDFQRSFGGLNQTSNLSYSVLHFFANGGGEAFVIRVPPKNAVPASSKFKRDDAPNSLSFELTALSSGVSGNAITVEVDAFGIAADPFGGAHEKKRFNLSITDQLTGRSERFANLSTSSSSTRFAPTVINDIGTGSKLVKMTLTGAAIDDKGPQATGSTYRLGAPLAAGTTAADVKALVSIAVVAADGSADAAASITDLPVTIFPKDSAKPVAALEFCTRVAAAINAALRADAPSASKMKGLGIEVAPFEGGALFRLRIQPLGPDAPSNRIAEAIVTLKDPAAGTKFLTEYTVTANANGTNPSRYQLGATFAAGSQIMASPVPGSDGDANGQPDTAVFKNAVMALAEPDPFFNLLCLPDLVRPAASDPAVPHHAAAMSIYQEAAQICQKKHAFLLIDPPPGVTDTAAAEAYKNGGIGFQSSHSAAYFPNIRVDDPLEAASIRSHPPSGAMAGLFARTDSQYGVWQAPAGTEASLNGVYGPSVELSDDQHGVLNPLGLNCIRRFPIFGTVAFGARTVDGSNALGSEWKYVPVRRTASYILRSLSEGLRWAVLKPNGEQLWSQLRLNATAFMHGLFRQGAFKGTSSREAYFVQCDASTTSGDDMNQGVVNIVVGFAPLKPAEFVLITLRQIVQPLI